MEVSLARLDALRRRGPSQMEALRKAFEDTTELLQVRSCPGIMRSSVALLHRQERETSGMSVWLIIALPVFLSLPSWRSRA